MKITFIGHAAILLESNGITLLSDPWWLGPCFGAQWWQYPEPYLRPLRQKSIDYIYISHGHNDHFHPGTLGRLNQSAKILASAASDLATPIKRLGFTVIQLAETEEFHLGNGLRCRIIPTTNDDTLMAVSDGQQTCLNLNDALHATPVAVQDQFVSRIKALYGSIDYLFCGYATASHFPNCYFIPGKDSIATAVKRQRFFNVAWAKIVHDFAPRFAFPFAGDVVILQDELFRLNEVVHNVERPTERFLSMYGRTTTQLFDIAPGFVVDSGTVLAAKIRQPLSTEVLATEWKAKIEKANYCRSVDRRAVEEVAELLEKNIRFCYPYLKTFAGNYRCIISLKNAPSAIEITKADKRIATRLVSSDSIKEEDYDVIYTTRLSYLRKSLTTTYGHEILFVGSGGIFHYGKLKTAHRAIHRELMVSLQKHDTCPKPRPRNWRTLVFQAQQQVKRRVQRAGPDLYSLREWTVYQ